LCILDEIHKYGQWKTFLKGCHDSYPEAVRLDVFKAGGDSLMGRYFTCRMHPLSVSELLHAELPDDSLIRNPLPLDEERFQILLKFGGFPEPFLRQNEHEPN
jgi:predicted AAA+ superfamily ATPase